MKTLLLCIIAMFLSVSVYAQNGKRVLVIIEPPHDNLLLELADSTGKQLRTVSFVRYEPAEQPVESSDETDAIAKGKEAYEFLRFDESLDILDKSIERLNAHLNSNESLSILREAYLYSAMDYLALDKATNARKAVDAYLCISGTPDLDANLWPPNLVHLIQKQLIGTQGSFVTVTVATNPTDAEIAVDGNPCGVSPVHLNLLQCTHYIRADKKTYLTKNVPITVSGDTHLINLELAPDTLIISDGLLSGEQIQYLSDLYKSDGILTLSSTVTQTTRQKDIWIKAQIVDAHTLADSSRTFIYKDPNHASAELARFVQPEQDVFAQKDVMRTPVDQNSTGSSKPASGAWYKNKWVWTAGAAIVAGCIVYATTNDGSHSSSTTGSLSVSW